MMKARTMEEPIMEKNEKRKRRPIHNLYFAIALILATGFLAIYALFYELYWLSLIFLFLCWFIDRKMYVCPFCGAKLSPRAKLNQNTICGKCSHNLYTGEVVKVQNGRMNIKKKDVDKYQR